MKLVDDIIRVIERFLIQILVVVISSIAAHADEPNPLGISFYGSFLHTEKVPNALFFFSEIKDEDSFELRKALRDHDIEIMVLSSEGGSVFEGLQMSGIINDKGLSTYIPGESPFGEGNCASACSYMFFAGKTRISDGKLGVHQFASAKPDEKAEIGEIQSNAQFVVSEIAGFLGEYDVPAFVYPKMFQSTEMYYFKRSEMREIERIQREISLKDLAKIEEFIEEFKAALKKLADNESGDVSQIEAEKIEEALPKPVEKITDTPPVTVTSDFAGRWYFNTEQSRQVVKCTPLSAFIDFTYFPATSPPTLIDMNSLANTVLFQPTGPSVARIQCREGGELHASTKDVPLRASMAISNNDFEIVGEVKHKGQFIGLTKLSFSRTKPPQKLTPIAVDKRTNHQTSAWTLTYAQQLTLAERNCLKQIQEITLQPKNYMLETVGMPYVGLRKDAKAAIVSVNCGDGISIRNDPTLPPLDLSDFQFKVAAEFVDKNDNAYKKIILDFTHPDNFPLRPLIGRWYLKYEERHGCYTEHPFYFDRSGSRLTAQSNNSTGITLTAQSAQGFLKCTNGGTVKLMGAPSFKNQYSDFSTVASICMLARECRTLSIAFSRVKSNPPKLPKTNVEQTQSYSAPKLTKKEQIQIAQQRLNQLGCKAGVADGILGKKTKKALQRFNQANNKQLSANSLHERSSINTLKTSSRRCYIPPLEGNWTLTSKNCDGYFVTAKATLTHRGGSKYDFYYKNNFGDVATGVLEDRKNIARIVLNWQAGGSEIVNLNLAASKKSVDGPWRTCWVTGRKN